MIPASDTPQPEYLDDPKEKCGLQEICSIGKPGKNTDGVIVCFKSGCKFDTRIIQQPDTGKQPEREYRITESQIKTIGEITRNDRIMEILRMSPITSAPEYEKYTGVCALQDKCNEYADFIESIMDELDDPDAGDPPCPIKCEIRKDPQQQAERESALIQRTLDDVMQYCQKHKWQEQNLGLAVITFTPFEKFIKELRQPPTTGSIPHICKTCGKSCRERRSDSECICGSWEGSTTSPAKGNDNLTDGDRRLNRAMKEKFTDPAKGKEGE